MIVYVGYSDYDYDGCSEPKIVFTEMQDVIKWCEQRTRREWKGIEVNESQ